MTRVLLHIVLPLLVPFALYLGWTWFAQMRARATGEPAPGLGEGPWFWFLGAGLLLAAAGLVYLAFTPRRRARGRRLPPAPVRGRTYCAAPVRVTPHLTEPPWPTTRSPLPSKGCSRRARYHRNHG